MKGECVECLFFITPEDVSKGSCFSKRVGNKNLTTDGFLILCFVQAKTYVYTYLDLNLRLQERTTRTLHYAISPCTTEL